VPPSQPGPPLPGARLHVPASGAPPTNQANKQLSDQRTVQLEDTRESA